MSILDWVPYSWSNVVLVGVQAALVALPAAGLPRWARPLAGRWWSLSLPLSIALVIGAIAVLPGTADVLTWLALLAIPPLAAAALGWAMRAAREWLAVLAGVALAVAIAALHTRTGQAAALALTALSCVTLGRLLAGGAPTPWLRAGLVVMATIDAILVFSHGIDHPNATLNAAIPAPGLPRLQLVAFGGASMGYGDVFVAGVLGAVLAAEGARARLQLGAAGAVAVASLLFDLLFAVQDTLPATVPVAAVTLLLGGLRGLSGAAPGPPSAARRARAGAAPPGSPAR